MAEPKRTWQDRQPFCFFPDTFGVSMQPNQRAKVDIDKYAGTWYEIARKPMGGQKDCVCSQAEYKNNGDHVSVFNQCNTPTGGMKSIKGKAYVANDFSTRLKVYFAPLIAGQYWILDIDPDYKWAIVGEPCRKFAWVLSREKKMPQHLLDARLQTLKNFGYELHDIIPRGDC